jgi:beta-galactosidase beta subunit
VEETHEKHGTFTSHHSYKEVSKYKSGNQKPKFREEQKTQQKKDNETNNDLQNTAQKTKI